MEIVVAGAGVLVISAAIAEATGAMETALAAGSTAADAAITRVGETNVMPASLVFFV